MGLGWNLRVLGKFTERWNGGLRGRGGGEFGFPEGEGGDEELEVIR